MDPRHPELAIKRLRELMSQYDRIEDDMNHATTSAQLGQLEREGGLVIQEICLVAPRIHEAMMQTSRQRRHDLSRGNVYEQMREYAATAERVEKPVEKPVEKDVNKTEEKVDISKPDVKEKPKKRGRKKKTTKKAEK